MVNAGVALLIPSDAELLKNYGKSMPLDSINSVLRNYASGVYYSKTNRFIKLF